ncbi:MAG TPA: RIP metalloprotease [Caulobacteraceae bacterium]|nr:RIP metalloprotease [Caulobacteraceae bacterium]
MFAPVLSALSYVAPFLFVLLLVVTVHELGHFTAARVFKVAIERFSVGFGRAIFKHRDRSGVEWRVGWIPLGGYVMFAGDENIASVPDQNDLDALKADIRAREGPGAERKYLPFKPLWQRAIVAAAGPGANFLLAIAIFSVLFATLGEMQILPRIGSVVPGSPAAAAGFQAGDLVLSADGRGVSSFEQLHDLVAFRAGEPIAFTVSRAGRTLALTAAPRSVVVDDPIAGSEPQGQIGIRPSTSPADLIHHRYGPLEAVGAGAARTWDVISTTVTYLTRLVEGKQSARELRSFIGIAQASHQVVVEGARGEHGLGAQSLWGFVNLINMAAVLSVSIGFANLMPIPVLDGGHLLFYAYEAVARRPVAAAVQMASYRVGLALLVGLMLFATTNDLLRINFFHFLGGPFS